MDVRSDMTPYLEEFRADLAGMDRAACVRRILGWLDREAMSLPDLYVHVLAAALNGMTDDEQGQPGAIWREHIRSGIVRTCIECCYPYVLRAAPESGPHEVFVVSPADEQHELGARMGTDFFTLCGYRTVFVGSDTPQTELLVALADRLPDYVVISAVNDYHLFRVKRVIRDIRKTAPDAAVLAAGRAFTGRKDRAAEVGADGIVDTLEDIRALREERDAR